MARVSAMESGSPTPISLQLANLIAGNARVAEFAYAGGDRIRNFIVRHQSIDHSARPIDCFPRVRIEQHRAALHRHFPDRVQRQIVAIDVKSFHKKSELGSQKQTLSPYRSPKRFHVLFRQRSHLHRRIGDNVGGLAFGQQRAIAGTHQFISKMND